MLQIFMRWFTNKPQAVNSTPKGVIEIDSATRQGGELIGRSVVAQLDAGGYKSLYSVGRHRPVVLGYLAAMAEAMAIRLDGENYHERYLALFIIAFEQVAGDPVLALAATDECEQLTAQKDNDYSTGGLMGKNDFQLLAQRVEPQRLTNYFRTQ